MTLDVINICERLERVFASAKIPFDLNALFHKLGDSLDLLHLTLDIEHEFKVEIPDENVAEFNTVNDIVIWLTEKS